MRTLIISVVAWSLIVAALVLFWPGRVPGAGCWRLVEPQPGCLDQLAELNRQLWWSQTAPMLAVIGGGYLVIAMAAVRSVRRRRRARRDGDPLESA